MRKAKDYRVTRAFEKAVASRSKGKYVLKLYVAGASERSRRALARARRLCEVELQGECTLEVIDIYQQPILARDGQIIATPTLVKVFPRPVRRLIGTLNNAARLFLAFDLQTGGGVRR
jgi:circadian clock protein KaiB